MELEYGGCGCCGSPNLEECSDLDQRAGYAYEKPGRLLLVSPENEDNWEEYSDYIVK